MITKPPVHNGRFKLVAYSWPKIWIQSTHLDFLTIAIQFCSKFDICKKNACPIHHPDFNKPWSDLHSSKEMISEPMGQECAPLGNFTWWISSGKRWVHPKLEIKYQGFWKGWGKNTAGRKLNPTLLERLQAAGIELSNSITITRILSREWWLCCGQCTGGNGKCVLSMHRPHCPCAFPAVAYPQTPIMRCYVPHSALSTDDQESRVTIWWISSS